VLAAAAVGGVLYCCCFVLVGAVVVGARRNDRRAEARTLTVLGTEAVGGFTADSDSSGGSEHRRRSRRRSTRQTAVAYGNGNLGCAASDSVYHLINVGVEGAGNGNSNRSCAPSADSGVATDPSQCGETPELGF
jgi:hypothetical protein